MTDAPRDVTSLADTCASILVALSDLDEIRLRALVEAERWCLNCLEALVRLGEMQECSTVYLEPSPEKQQEIRALKQRWQVTRARALEEIDG
jgi:hypothetical protein